jgi:hypothetical protein
MKAALHSAAASRSAARVKQRTFATEQQLKAMKQAAESLQQQIKSLEMNAAEERASD